MARSDASDDACPIRVRPRSPVHAADPGQGWARPVDEVSLGPIVVMAGDGSTLEESLASPTVERVSGRSVALPLMIAALVALVGFGVAGRLSAGKAGTSVEPASAQTAIATDARSAAERAAGPGTVDVAPGAPLADGAGPHSLSTAEWEALYGPVAATWGVWESPHSMSSAEWETLYGPVAATWGVWESPHSVSTGPTGDRPGKLCRNQCPR